MYWDLTECCWHVSLLLHALHWNFRLIRWCVPQWSFQAVVGLGAAVTAAVLTWLWLRLREEEDEVVFRETSVRLLHQNMLNLCLETLILMLCQAVHLQPLHQHCFFCYDEDTFHRWSTGVGLGMSFWYMRRTVHNYTSPQWVQGRAWADQAGGILWWPAGMEWMFEIRQTLCHGTGLAVQCLCLPGNNLDSQSTEERGFFFHISGQ